MNAAYTFKNIGIIAGFSLLSISVCAPGAHAQFGSFDLHEGAGHKTVQDSTGTHTVAAPSLNSTVTFSPLTVFQFGTVTKDPNSGKALSKKQTLLGSMVQLEKRFSLKENIAGERSYTALGAWYWSSGSSQSPSTRNQLAVYAQWFHDTHYGIQINSGGDTESGLWQTYAFFIANIAKSTNKSNGAVQVGFGPFIPRASYGDAGYTGYVAAGYRLTPIVSLSASYWFVNYQPNSSTFGQGASNTQDRYSVALSYSFH